LDDLRRGRGGQAAPGTSAASRPHRRPAESHAAAASTEVSLRGLRIDEAEPLLAKALDDAVLAELPYLRVIHGKGTGAMRQFVHDVLERDPRVQRFGFAPANQGGHGVTVVEFKP
jgi:DNA mismatch repair protein MutS2